jgi:hypothetical protein
MGGVALRTLYDKLAAPPLKAFSCNLTDHHMATGFTTQNRLIFLCNLSYLSIRMVWLS